MALSQYGVWMLVVVALIVFIESGVLFPVLPGDSMLFALGLLHTQLHLDLPLVCIVLIISSIFGAQIGYWFGLFFGARFFKPDATVLKTEHLVSAEKFFSKWGGPAVVLGRFIPFIRTFVPIAAGIGRYRWSRFSIWNIVGSILWTFTFTFAGVFLGGIPFIRNNVEIIALVIIVASVLPVAVALLKKSLTSKAFSKRKSNQSRNLAPEPETNPGAETASEPETAPEPASVK